MEKKILWETYKPAQKKELECFCEEYKAFLSACKTERECVDEFAARAEKYGYKNLAKLAGKKLKKGDKVYAINHNKAIMLVQIGQKPLTEGLNILGAHIDSPRLDLKPNPLYEDSGFALFKTHYYGGVKKYQWVATPLAIHGIVAKKDGTVVKVVLGEDPADPVVAISDLLPHLGKDQMAKTLSDAFTGEDLNVCVGNVPAPKKKDEEAKDPVKANVLKLLKAKYGIEEEDFLSAELEIVPAGPARDLGFDRSMIIGYGHDDRICAYTSFAAQMDCPKLERSAVTILVDKEEIGSVGASGMTSAFFENTVAEIMEACGCFSDMNLRKALANSDMLSSDVGAAFDPNFASVYEKQNAPFFGYGPCMNKYTGARGKSGSNDADAEFIAKLRQIFDEANVHFQLSELGKVDQGGGGTIAYIPAKYGMDVIDVGIALHNMHAPFEVASKADIYEGYLAYKAFLNKMA